jgi:hypothetical protein
MIIMIIIVMEVTVVKVVKVANQLINKIWKKKSFKVLNTMRNKNNNLIYNKTK